MTLTKCPECGHQISMIAEQCPSCGAKLQRTTLLSKLVAGFFGLVLFSIVVGQYSSDTASTPSSTANAPPLAVVAPTPEQRAEAERQRRIREIQAFGLTWRYNETMEQMGRGIVKHAQVNSLNEISFDFPYRGAQRATLWLRSHPKHGKDVMLSVERGQFLCRIGGCTVAVRFDEGRVQSFSAAGPADHSTTTLFLSGHDRFVSAAKNSKRVAIEATFFQEGTRVFKFDVEGLKWL